MDFVVAHTLFFGLAADFITLIGALILTKEAFGRLRDVVSNRIQADFETLYPGLPLVDQEKAAARRIVNFARLGSSLLILGFALQALTRVAEDRKHSSEHTTTGSISASATPSAVAVSNDPVIRQSDWRKVLQADKII